MHSFVPRDIVDLSEIDSEWLINEFINFLFFLNRLISEDNIALKIMALEALMEVTWLPILHQNSPPMFDLFLLIFLIFFSFHYFDINDILVLFYIILNKFGSDIRKIECWSDSLSQINHKKLAWNSIHYY